MPSRAPDEPDFLKLVWDRAHTSPGKLAATALGLILLVLLAGFTTAQSVAERQSGTEAVLHRAEPLANATQVLYSELSTADAITGTVFLSPGLESQELRERYDRAIAAAEAASVMAASGTQSAQLLIVVKELPVYTALIESAKVYNRAGKPVGSAYLSQASNLMQTVILPAADEMHRQQIDALEAAQSQQTRPPLLPVALVALTLICLAFAQLRLAKRSRRQFNPPLLLTTAGFAILLVWFLVAGAFLVALSNEAQHEGTDPLRTLTTARILAQQARTQETLQLLRRGDEEQLEQQYQASMQGAYDQLARLSPAEGESGSRHAAAIAWRGWTQTHKRLEGFLSEGKYRESVELAIGPGQNDCAAQYRALDQALTADIDHSRSTLRNSVAEGHSALTGLAQVAVVFTFCAIALICAGYWPRINEYRA